MDSARISVAFVVFLGWLSSATTALPQEKISPKTQAIIDALEKVLPEYEQAADRLDKELQPFLNSPDPKVASAVDSARLQILSIRSVRKIIAEQPNYLLYHIGPANLQRWKEGAEYYLDCARAAKDPFAGMMSGVRPVRSGIDGQLLLYKFTLPKDYDPAKKYPLRVELHAGGGFTWLAYWVMGKPDNSPRGAATDGAIHISPAGRQHIGMGEVAILDAIADARKHYAIDEDRIIIGGASWGGTGGFHFATFLPDRFAAAYSLTGGGNYNLPVGNGRFDAYMLPDNLCNLPFLLWDTPGDGHYQANHAFADALRQRAQRFPGYYPNLELTDPKGSHGIIDRKLQEEGWAWMHKQARNRYPKLVIYKTHWLRYDGANWARIDTLKDASLPARIEAEVNDGGCRVEVDNVDRFHLDLAPKLVGAAKEINVRINGDKAIKAATGRNVYFWKTAGQWSILAQRYPQTLVKKHGVSGPLQDVFMEHPVLMVHGSARDKTTITKMLDDIVNRLISTGDGSGILRTGFERKADTEISDQDIAEKNLILIGTPKQNRLLSRIADKLPATFLDDGVCIGGKEYRGPDVSLVMVYPNPLNPERYLLLLPEVYWGTRPLDYPDWVVLQAPKDGKGPGRILAKGSFDTCWQNSN
jgi:pimeloyl-ACP methyl ester carboxylesterase